MPLIDGVLVPYMPAGTENKPERCSPSALVPLRGNNFYSMRNVESLAAMEGSAPEFHRRAMNGLIASGKVRDNDDPSIETTSRSTVVERLNRLSSPVTIKRLFFAEGVKVKDTQEGRKGIIIKASVGHTKKHKIPVHRVSDANGDIWLAKETNLRIR